MLEPNLEEALRYLGVPQPPPPELLEQAREVSARLCAAVQPRWVYRVFPLSRAPEGSPMSLAGTAVTLAGNSAETMLAQCHSAALLVCTLGAGFDAMLRAWQARDMAAAVLLDACGSALVERGCDEAEGELSALLPGQFLTDRFSPGYGDLPLELQGQLCQTVDAGRRLGVTVTPSLLMNPGKSVSAVIGVADRPQMARVRGCAFCAMRENCRLRKGGKSCGL